MAELTLEANNYVSTISFGESSVVKCKRSLKKISLAITVEPVVVFWWFGLAIQLVVTPQLYYEKVCKLGSSIFGNGSSYPEDVCDHLDNGNYDHIQDEVQKTVSRMNFVMMFVSSVPSIIFVLFVGPWSDRAGRKMLFLIPLVGFILNDVCLLLNSIFFDELPPEALMLEVLKDWFGGSSCIFLGVYSYIADVSTLKDRTARLALIDCVYFVTMTIASFASGKIYVSVGYTVVYGISTGFHLLSFFYVFFVLQEPQDLIQKKLKSKGLFTTELTSEEMKNKDEDHKKQSRSCLSLFSLRSVSKSFTVAFRKRKGHMRHVVVLLIAMFAVNGIAMHGTNSISNSYVRKKFEWESTDQFNMWWSQLSGISSIFSIIAIGIVLPVATKVFKLRDMMIAILSISSLLLGNVMYLLAWNPNALYLANLLKMFSDATTVTIRATLTKIVGPLDVGKVFACVAAVQALSDLASPLYNIVYIASIEWHLGMTYCISATLLMVMLVVCTYTFFFLKNFEKKHGNFSSKTDLDGRPKIDEEISICDKPSN